MKNINLFLLLIVLIPFLSFAQPKSGKIIFLHTNDLHSNLTGFGPEIEYTPCLVGDDNTLGGFSRIAAVIQNERRNFPEQVIVLDAGDFLMGTFFHLFEQEHGFQLGLMKKMGYDVVSIGNHEFDFGPEALAKIINSTLKNYGDMPALTLSNIEFSKKSNKDDALEDLYNKGIIKPYTIIERGGIRIGVFGLLGIDADNVSPYKKPVKVTNRIKKAKEIVKVLKTKENVDLVVCLSHCGVAFDLKSSKWSGEDVELAEKVKGIDIIVGGHTHHEIMDPIVINNTYILQTGSQGKKIGRLEINLSQGKIANAKFQLINIDDNIYGDCKIHQEIAGRIKLIDDELLKPMNLGYYRSLAETNFELESNEQQNLDSTNLGPFIADALKYYINNYSPVKTDITMVAAGVIRDKIYVGNKGIQSAPDIFRIMSLGEGDDNIPGYPLAMVYLTGREIKNIIELLLVAQKMKPSYYCFYSGVKVEYDGTKGFLKKIQKIYVDNENIDFSKKNKKLYAIAANSYMLDFLGEINGMTFGLVKVIPKDLNGNKIKDNKSTWIDFDSQKQGIQEGKEWLALIKYLQSFKDLNNNNIPDIPDSHIKPAPRIVDISTK